MVNILFSWNNYISSTLIIFKLLYLNNYIQIIQTWTENIFLEERSFTKLNYYYYYSSIG